MPPKAKADPPVEPTPPSEPPAPAGPPAHANELCELCGQAELHPSTTVFACEHGTWTFGQ